MNTRACCRYRRTVNALQRLRKTDATVKAITVEWNRNLSFSKHQNTTIYIPPLKSGLKQMFSNTENGSEKVYKTLPTRPQQPSEKPSGTAMFHSTDKAIWKHDASGHHSAKQNSFINCISSGAHGGISGYDTCMISSVFFCWALV